MVDFSKFESICPYTDEEAVEALSKVADNPLVIQVSRYFFPDKEPEFLKNLLKSVRIGACYSCRRRALVLTLNAFWLR